MFVCPKVFFFNEKRINHKIQCLQMFVPVIHHRYGPRLEKTCLWEFANNKGADHPPNPLRLISAFVIHLLESIISQLASIKISIFKLVSVVEEAGLSLTLFESPDRFCRFDNG